MFGIAKKHTLILSLIALDLLLVLDINTNLKNNSQEVLGTQIVAKQKVHIAKKPNKIPPTINSVYIAKKYPSLTPVKAPTSTPTPTNEKPQSQTSNASDDTSNTGSQTSSQSQSVVIVESNSLLNQINQFRSSNGKGNVSENSETCSFANTRAIEIASAFNHDGFKNRINSKTLPYPSYSEVAENIAMNGDISQVIPGWINSSGHAENMLKDVPYGCVVGSGIYYVFEAWRP